MKLLRAAALVGVALASSSAAPALSAAIGPLLADHDWLPLPEEPALPVEPEAPTAAIVEVPPRPDDPYLGQRYDLDRLREGLAVQRQQGIPVEHAAGAVLARYLPALLESWIGTGYSYSGTSEVPGEGQIACGYYVSTVLEHAGFSLDRVEVARQASEQIIRTFVPDDDIQRFHRARRRDVVASVEAQGPGVWIVGLDTHVGFLLNDGEAVRFCHSTRRQRQGVVCEEAVSSPSLKSRYTVLGRLDNPVAVDHWLDGARFVTARRGVRQGPSFGTLPEAGPVGGDPTGPTILATMMLP